MDDMDRIPELPESVVVPMLTQIVNKVIRLLFFSDLHASRATLAFAETLWALSLLWPGATFDRPAYMVMSRVMSEEAWGLVFALSSITQFYILFSGKYHDRLSVAFAGWNSVLWTYVTVSMYLSVYPPPAAISGEAALSFAASWIFIRSGWIPTGLRSKYAVPTDKP